ncbi:carbonic anhydrase [Paenibacillus sp. PK4536]|jgi:carbonic anhydrase|uniref:carbonic anhydrase n=2 Tax=Paenibacillus TaxID=44249 RepID=A0A1E3L954_9BACL|nr:MULTISPECIES: carbonic anhydrase [Paenibacillus]MDN4617812.1 carbonic anhydrase [Paenibacillus sp. PsM32]MDQ1234543.1 carbonic anhydrase [Paenibacillus sp. SORGH_AS_0306]MDR6111589.1 carbonic anhydrase [Paenibacillus sp. SORGH_AS_0338]ODP30101.1 Carbonate dehydratase [Paenibacillus nuruki]TKJ92651.1 carbonic anhydrase [Paenibacillus sp. CFBP13512]
MNSITTIMQHNQEFVTSKEYEAYLSSPFPEKKLVILTCMDTRLTELLPKAMNIRNGDAKILKNAGAIISQPFGSVMRSILVAIYELKAEEVIVVGHHGCGMASLNSDHMIEKIHERGIAPEVLTTLENSGIKLKRWLQGFDNEKEGVMRSVDIIKNHPLLPASVPVHGMIIDPATGQLELLVNGYDQVEVPSNS